MRDHPSAISPSPADSTRWLGPSVLSLLIGNMIPLLGVIFLGWELRNILLLYWAESAIIGIFTILKMLITSPLPAIFLSAFFCVHYGIFMTVHLVFLLGITGGAFPRGSSSHRHSPFDGLGQVLTPGMFVALAALFISHGISFATHFLAKREYLHTEIGKLMAAPYPRIFIMHITIIGGAFLMIALGQPLGLLLLLVILKTAVDLASHLREHRTSEKIKEYPSI